LKKNKKGMFLYVPETIFIKKRRKVKKMGEDIFKKVQEILVTELAVKKNKVKPNSDLASDLGADSLDLVEITMSIEMEFDITVEDSEIEGIKTVQDIVELIQKKTEKA